MEKINFDKLNDYEKLYLNNQMKVLDVISTKIINDDKLINEKLTYTTNHAIATDVKGFDLTYLFIKNELTEFTIIVKVRFSEDNLRVQSIYFDYSRDNFKNKYNKLIPFFFKRNYPLLI